MIFRCIYKTKTGVKNNLPYGRAMLISPPYEILSVNPS